MVMFDKLMSKFRCDDTQYGPHKSQGDAETFRTFLPCFVRLHGLPTHVLIDDIDAFLVGKNRVCLIALSGRQFLA